ncbi:MAG: DUF1249 domain-containing protein [Gammaproteobacteria bacterium]|nr:DUF1249 domain-containing protein [Gammaproteobacteria bacterium]
MRSDSVAMKQGVLDQMRCYEANFERLVWLIPALQDMEGSARSLGIDAMELRLEILERGKYTATIALTHHFHRPGSLVSDPYMRIRLYTDARVAEVLSYQGHARPQLFQPYPILNMANLREKHRINRFLGEWLDYCIARGHRFADTSRCAKA